MNLIIRITNISTQSIAYRPKKKICIKHYNPQHLTHIHIIYIIVFLHHHVPRPWLKRLFYHKEDKPKKPMTTRKKRNTTNTSVSELGAAAIGVYDAVSCTICYLSLTYCPRQIYGSSWTAAHSSKNYTPSLSYELG